MKLLVDASAGQRLAQASCASDHDVLFAGDWTEDPGDDEILARAGAEERVVLTRDRDFGPLAVRDRRSHCGIVRLVELPTERELAICQDVLARHVSALRGGALITAEVHRIRIREPSSVTRQRQDATARRRSAAKPQPKRSAALRAAAVPQT